LAAHPVALQSEDDLIECIKSFATSYDAKKKIWAYPAEIFTHRSNCHVFQEEMRVHCLVIWLDSPVFPPEGVKHGKLLPGASGRLPHKK
jgi:hypothetical protein